MPSASILKLLQLGLKKPKVAATAATAATAAVQSDDADAVVLQGGRAIRALTRPIARVIGSRLEETINALPDDWTMKERGVKNALKRFANQTGTGIKDEEFDFSKLLDDTSSKRLTKKDLQLRIQSRRDVFSVTTLVGRDASNFHSGTILSDFDSFNYRVSIRRYRDAKDTLEDRRTTGHMARLDIFDELYWSRKSDITLGGNKGTISWEGQSDQLNTGSTVGFSPQEASEKLQTALKKDLALEKEILEMQNRISVLNKLNDDAYDATPTYTFKDWKASPEAAELYQLSYSVTSREDRLKAGYKPNLKDRQKDKSSNERRIKRINESINTGESKFETKFGSLLLVYGKIGKEVSTIEEILSNLNIPLKDKESKDFVALTALDMISLKDLKKQLTEIELGLEDVGALHTIVVPAEVIASKKLIKTNAIKNVTEKMKQRIIDFYHTDVVRKNIKGQFGLVPQELPLSNSVWVEKWIEQDLVDAYLDGKSFFAVPIKPGTTELVRGENVIDFYENTVVNIMERKVNQWNNEILKHNPNAVEANLFSFERFISKESEIGINFIDETGIKKFVYGMSEEDINLILAAPPKVTTDAVTFLDLLSSKGIKDVINMFDEKRVADRVTAILDDGTITNFEHAFYEAKRQEVIDGLQRVGPRQAREALEESFGPNGVNLIQKKSHELGMIYLPEKSIVKSKVLRSIGEQDKRLDQKATVEYITNASIPELKSMMNSIKDIDFENLYSRSSRFSVKLDDDFFKPRDINEVLGRIELAIGESQFAFWDKAKLNKLGEGRIRSELLNILNDLPSLAVEKISTVTGIKLKSLVSGTEVEVLPTWMNRISNYAVIPVVGVQVEDFYDPKSIIDSPNTKVSTSGVSERSDQQAINRSKIRDNNRLRAEISQSLKDPGVTNRNIVDFLVNNRGRDRDEITGMVNAVVEEKVMNLLKRGMTPNQIFDSMIKKGYEPEDIVGYLPSESFLEDVLDFTLNNLEMTKSMVSVINDLVVGLTITSKDEDKKASQIIAIADAANTTVTMILNDFSIPLTAKATIEAKKQSNALTAIIIKGLQDKGIDFTVDEYGQILLPDSNGQYLPFTVNFYDIALAHRDEAIGALGVGIIGFKQGAKIPGPPIVKAIGAAVGAGVGSMFGTAFGRGTDIVRNRLWLKQELDGKFIFDQMVQTGAADGIVSLILAGILKTGGGTWKLVKWAFDKVAKGNLDGGYRALMEFTHMTPELADIQVEKWRTLNPNVALSSNRKIRHFEVLSRTHPLAYRIAQPAMQLNSQASINMSREVNKRQLDMINTISSKTNPQYGSVLSEALPQYIKRVQDIYDGTKNYAIELFKKSKYRFDYNKLVIEPTLRKAIDGIDNPQIVDQLQALFQRIKTIGGKKLEAKDGTKFDLPNPRRTFSDLLELRELIVKFSRKRNITGTKDIAKIDSIIANIDKEISKAVRDKNGPMEEGSKWLTAWKDSKQAMENMVSIKSNILYKAIIRDGTSDKAIMNALVKASQSLDGTYREVLQALPKNLHAPTEAALLRELIDRATIKSIGGSEGLQAIDFVALEIQLRHIPFGTKENQMFKQAIGEMSRVFKNDPHLLAASGTVRGDAFATFLTTDPEARIKYAFMTKVFNYVTRLLPGESGRKAAMLIKLGQVLRKPHDSTLVESIMKALPPDPVLQNQLRAQLAQIADYNAKSVFPRVKVFGTSKVGHISTPTHGPLGFGKYFYMTRGKARATSKTSKGSKLHTEDILEDHIADEAVIRRTLGLSEDAIIKPEMIKNSKRLREMLEGQAYNGIIFKDTIIIF